MTRVRIAALSELPEGKAFATEVGATDIALVRDGESVYAIEDWCSHAEYPLSDGDVDLGTCEIECMLHGSRFSLKTGIPSCLPATEPVPIFATTVEGDDVYVDVPDSETSESNPVEN